MGCASSNPLVEGGKNLMDNAKQATDNVIDMGEKAMHGAGDAVNTGIENVKNVVESGIQTAQNSLGSVVNNIENTMGMAKNKAEETVAAVDNNVEDVTNKTSELVEETISDAKTVLAFEDATSTMENEIKEIETMEMETALQLSALKDEFGETVEQVESKMEETLHIEDVEHVSSDDVLVTSTTEDAKEHPPPTPWEAAADEILKRSMSIPAEMVPALDGDDSSDDIESNTDTTTHNSQTSNISTSTTSTLSTTNSTVANTTTTISSDINDTTTSSKTDNKDFGGNNTSDLLLSDTISIKSYKSEI